MRFLGCYGYQSLPFAATPALKLRLHGAPALLAVLVDTAKMFSVSALLAKQPPASGCQATTPFESWSSSVGVSPLLRLPVQLCTQHHQVFIFFPFVLRHFIKEMCFSLVSTRVYRLLRFKGLVSISTTEIPLFIFANAAYETTAACGPNEVPPGERRC